MSGGGEIPTPPVSVLPIWGISRPKMPIGGLGSRGTRKTAPATGREAAAGGSVGGDEHPVVLAVLLEAHLMGK